MPKPNNTSRKKRISALISLYMLSLGASEPVNATPEAAPMVPRSPAFVAMPTRLVTLFTEQEKAIAAALIKGDHAALDRLVAENFELRAGSRADQAVPRDAWLAHSQAHPEHAAMLSPQHMAVWDFGTNAVVNFKWTNTGQAQATDLFVIDVWKRTDDNWKLAIRFIDPTGPVDTIVPGLAPAEEVIPKKY